MKMFKIARLILIADVFIKHYIIIGVKAFGITIFDSNVPDLIVSWIPVILLGIEAVIYSCFMCSKKFLPMRKYIYSALLSQATTVTALMLPIKYFHKISWIAWAILIITAFAAGILCNFKLEKQLNELGPFSIDEELSIVEKAKNQLAENQNQKISKWFGYIVYLYIIPFVISADPMVCIMITIPVAIAEYCLFVSLKKSYDIITDETDKHSLIKCSILFWFCVLTGILSYVYIDFKLLSFVLFFATALPKYIYDNKLIMFFRDENE